MERKKCVECREVVYWVDRKGVCFHCRNTYKHLLAKIGPVRMAEIQREAHAAVDELLGV